MTGTKLSARVLTVVVIAKVAVIVLVVVVGATHINMDNYQPFVPMARAAPATASPTLLGWILDSSFGSFGMMGIFTAASSIVFAYIGFDLIATASEDARSPRKTVPQGMLLGVGAVTILYIAMAVVLVGMRPYGKLGGSRTGLGGDGRGRGRVGREGGQSRGAARADDGDHGRPDRAEPRAVQHGP